VYRAEHVRLGCPVAVKVLRPAVVSSGELQARFEREARALSSLIHPNVVSFADYGVDRVPFLVMELLEGQTLSKVLRDGPLEPRRAFEIARQILRALVFAHGQNLIHRDLKPGNIFLQRMADGADHVKILDFGLAKFVAGDRPKRGPQLTVTGVAMGTPAYMSPEQATGMEVDQRTDLYALGTVLYQMLAGRTPFKGQPDELLRQQLLATVPSLATVCPSRKFDATVQNYLTCALAKVRDDRFPDAASMLSLLNALPEEPATIGQDVVGVEAVKTGPTLQIASAPPVDAAPTTISQRRWGQSLSRRPSRWVASWRPLVISAAAGVMATLVVSAAVVPAGQVGDTPARAAEEEAPKVSKAVSEDRHTASPTGPEVPPSPPMPAAPPPLTPVDPWADELPETLARAKAVLDRGTQLSPQQLRSVRGYSTRHRSDARAFLLLARNSIRRGHLTDGIVRYQRAAAADRTGRFDPQMQSDLIRLVNSRAVGRLAEQALERIYGVEATVLLRRALLSPDLDESDRERLESLERRLGAL
jgi:serine/threonine-protein kinase